MGEGLRLVVVLTPTILAISIIQRSWVSEKPEIKTHPHWLLNCRSASSITSSISVAIVILLLELCYHYTICIV